MNLRRYSRCWRFAAAVALSGTALQTTGCSDELRAAIVGLDAAVDALEHDDDDISFRDWLDSEFDHAF